jgi:hypothetical protein
MSKAFPGMLYDLDNNNHIISGISEETTSFDYGVCVVRGTTDPERGMLLPTAVGAVLGVVAHSHAREVGSDNLNLVDPARASNVLHEGRIWVRLEGTSGAVVAGNSLFVRTAAPSAVPVDDEALGRFRADADGGDALALSLCTVVVGGTGGEMIAIEIDKNAVLS